MKKHADLFFWIVAIVALFWMLGQRGLWGAEGRWAQVAREMLLTGGYFHPTINGAPYFDKPLIGYWLVVLVSFLTGLNEWALRVPSAMAALAALWAVRRLGGALWDDATGRLAGWILLTSQAFLFWGRTGMTDMANLAFIMLAVTWYWLRRERPGFAVYLIFYLLLFTGAQMKGLPAVIIPVLVVTPDLLYARRWPHLLGFSHFGALALGALVYILPFTYAAMTGAHYESCGIQMVVRENIQRFFDPFDHIEPFHAYFKHLPILFLPWSPILVAAIFSTVRQMRTRQYAWPARWLGLAMLLIFAFFTASGSRRSYYILPLLPFCAIFCARWLLTLPAGVWNFRWRRMPGVPGLPHGPGALVVILGVPLLAYFCLLQPVLSRFRTERPFARAIRDTGRQAGETAFFEHPLENMVFYMDMQPRHPVLTNSATAYAYLADGHDNIIILRQYQLPAMLSDFPPDNTGRLYMAESRSPLASSTKQAKRRIAWTLTP